MHAGWFFRLKPVVGNVVFKSAKIPEAIVFHAGLSIFGRTVVHATK